MPTPHDPLDPLLERWRDATPPLAPLAPDVWRRIAAAESAPPSQGWLARLLGDFARPAFAAMFVAACALLGLFLAEVRLSRLQAERNAQLAKSYLRLIDPLLVTETSRNASESPRS